MSTKRFARPCNGRGITGQLWEISDIVNLLEEWEISNCPELAYFEEWSVLTSLPAAEFLCCRMDKFSEYRRFVDECLREAKKAPYELDRYRWLKLAQQYMALLPTKATSAEAAFAAEEQAKGTGQEDSGSSH